MSIEKDLLKSYIYDLEMQKHELKEAQSNVIRAQNELLDVHKSTIDIQCRILEIMMDSENK